MENLIILSVHKLRNFSSWSKQHISWNFSNHWTWASAQNVPHELQPDKFYVGDNNLPTATRAFHIFCYLWLNGIKGPSQICVASKFTLNCPVYA